MSVKNRKICFDISKFGREVHMDPVKVKPWNTILDATSEKEGCPQFSLKKQRITGDEDCLYNNIQTTDINLTCDNLKAVVVNIHPGGYIHGSPDPCYYGSPEYVINRDIVYVSVGYRLHNMLGHLNLNLKNHCTRNQSLKDIILSLEWIRDNIRVFGGDPRNITLLGSSSGSAIVHGLLLSPLAKGLYHKAILMGMYIFNPTLITCNEHIALAYKIAQEQGYEGEIEDRRKLLNFLKKIRVEHYLLSKLHEIRDYYTGLPVFPTSPFIPLGEPSDNSPWPLSPDKLIASTNRVPLMVGFCKREGAMGAALLEKLKKSLSQLFHKCLSQNVWGWGANLNEDESKQIQQQAENFYVDGKSLDEASQSIKCDILTDVALSDVYDTLINVVSSDASSPVYVYNFAYDGKLCTVKKKISPYMEKPLDGAFHADDYAYWCFIEDSMGGNVDQQHPKDRKMIDTLTNLFTTFAKNGNPNNVDLQVNWEPSKPESPCYLNINEELEMKHELLNGKRMEFWHNLKKQFGEHCEK